MKQKFVAGFTVVEVILLLVTIGILSSAGWYIWRSARLANRLHAQNVTNAQSVTGMKTYVDTAKLYTVRYPADWQLSYDEPQGSESAPVAPDWTMVSRGISLLPANVPPRDSFGRSLTINVGSAAGAMKVVNEDKQAVFHTVTHHTIHGHDAFLDRLDFVGPAAAEKYTDEAYTIINGNTAVTLYFRVKYYHNTVMPVVSWDDSADLPAYLAIVQSVQFL